MAFQRTDAMGGQAIADVSTTQQHPFGFRVKAYDPTTYLEGEFVYGKGVASTIVGSLATINLLTGVTALTVARSKGLCGVAMALLVASTFGWYQVRGTGVIACNGTVVAGSTVYLTVTGGKVDDAVVTGDIVYGANFASADGTPAANLAQVFLADPWVGDTDNA